jgi:hypothetical protein
MDGPIDFIILGMEEPVIPLEELWERLLSGDASQVREAFASLSAAEQAAVLAHLERMVSEEGWQPSQRESARAALEALHGTEAR